MSMSFVYVRATAQPVLIDGILVTSEPRKFNPARLSSEGKASLEARLINGSLELTHKPAPREKLSDVILGNAAKKRDREKVLSDANFSHLEARGIEFSEDTSEKKEIKKRWPRRKFLVIIPLMLLLASLFLLLSK